MVQRRAPAFTGDVTSWARAVSDYLRDVDRIKQQTNPEVVQLAHQVTGDNASAASAGLLMYDPTFAALTYSHDGQWWPIYGSATPPEFGLGMHWDSLWAGGSYDAGSVVLDYPYLAIANKPTTDRPAPTPIGDPYWQYDGTMPNESGGNRASVTVYLRMTLEEDAQAVRLRVYARAGQRYEVSFIDQNGVLQFLLAFVATQTGWVIGQARGTIAQAGDQITMVMAITNPSGPQIFYDFDPNYWAANPNRSGAFRIDGGTITETQDAYGIDVELQNLQASDDWDIMAISGGGSGGSIDGFLPLTGGTLSGPITFTGFDVDSNAFVFDASAGGAYMSWDDGIGGNRLAYFGYTEASSKAVFNVKDSSNSNAKRYDFTPTNADEDNTVLRRIDGDARYLRPDVSATITQIYTFGINQFFTGGLADTSVNGNIAKFGNAELSIQTFQSGTSRYIGFVPRNTGDTANIWNSRLAWDEALQSWCIGTAPIQTALTATQHNDEIQELRDEITAIKARLDAAGL